MVCVLNNQFLSEFLEENPSVNWGIAKMNKHIYQCWLGSGWRIECYSNSERKA